MKVGDLVQPAIKDGLWIGLVTALSVDELTGKDIATVRWNREEHQAENEYCYQLEVINESR